MATSITKILKPGDEAALEAFLLPRIDSSMFLLGNLRAAGLEDHGLRLQGTYSAVMEDGKIVGAVAHYWSGNLVLQTESGLPELCAHAVKSSGRPIRGLIGPSGQVETAKRALGISPVDLQLDETENLYSLDLRALAIPEILSSGKATARLIGSGDVDLLTEWNAAYAVEALGDEDGPGLRQQCREETSRSVEEGRTWVLETDGKPVAMSAFNTAVREAVQVGGVFTPPALRRRGYARAVVAASLISARLEGAEKGILFTGLNNIAAQKAYLSLGFHCVGDYRILLLNKPVEIDAK